MCRTRWLLRPWCAYLFDFGSPTVQVTMKTCAAALDRSRGVQQGHPLLMLLVGLLFLRLDVFGQVRRVSTMFVVAAGV